MSYFHSQHECDAPYEGPFETFEAAVADGVNHKRYGTDFFVSAGSKRTLGHYLPSAETLLQDAEQMATDDGGPEDIAEVSQQARCELDALLNAWAKKYLTYTFWSLSDEDAVQVDAKGVVLPPNAMMADMNFCGEPEPAGRYKCTLTVNHAFAEHVCRDRVSREILARWEK